MADANTDDLQPATPVRDPREMPATPGEIDFLRWLVRRTIERRRAEQERE